MIEEAWYAVGAYAGLLVLWFSVLLSSCTGRPRLCLGILSAMTIGLCYGWGQQPEPNSGKRGDTPSACAEYTGCQIRP